MKTVKVWDIAVRGFHWALSALVLVSFLTAEDEAIGWHARAGIVIAGLLLFRLIWGFLGPRQARFRTFVRGPAAVIAYLRDYVRGRPPRHLSHNPLGALMVVALLAVLFGAVATGALAYASAEWDGPLSAWIGAGMGDDLEEVHEVLANALLFLVPMHVVGVIVSSFLERQNLVKGMITGRKLATEGELPATPRLARLVVTALVTLAVVWGAAQLLLPRVASAAVTADPTAVADRQPRKAKNLSPANRTAVATRNPRDASAAAPASSTPATATRQPTDAGPAALYAEECAACHIAYPPGLLPAGSWRKVMAGLDAHFEEDASLPEADRARIEGWLVASAAESGSHKKSPSIMRSLRGATPLRITEVPYMREKHDELTPDVFERPSIESRSNCAACHPNAKTASFKRHRVPKS